MPDHSPFATRLLEWFDCHGRHDLPWQQPRTPYRVWVSEIMLQQTQVTTVIPYFERFMARFPTVASLAEAPTDAVLAHWAGLGYYARARNLQKAAQQMQSLHGGSVPDTLEALEALPGIGRSTAGAILSQGFGRRAAILDGNVKRVLCRHEAIEGWPGETAVNRQLWAVAERHTPPDRAADYTQAIMDLGATLCTARRPACDRCPVQASCQAFQLQRAGDFPASRRKAPLPTVQRVVWVRLDPEDRVYLQRRPAEGIWGGLWSLPESEPNIAPEQALQLAQARGWLRSAAGQHAVTETAPVFRHTFSHYHLLLQPLIMRGTAPEPVPREDEGWFPMNEVALPPLPSPIRRWLLRFAQPLALPNE